MTFLAVVVVFLIVQLVDSVEALHADGWYRDWSARTRRWFDSARLILLAQLLLPVLGLWLLLDLVDGVSLLLLFLLTVPLLIYSLGRGDFLPWVKGYLTAVQRNDNEMAADYAERLGADIRSVDDWRQLHARVLCRAAYCGFERWFAVLFWFVLLGPLGAVFYRLAALSSLNSNNPLETRVLALRLLWLLEWPAVRLLGLSFGLTGNFSSCYSRSLGTLLDTNKGSAEVLESYVHGALNVNEQDLATDGVTDREIEALQPLLSRTLILWICALAILSLI
ncbi:MAG: regulatory signaling modulator protein AmpE [Gammaproteobacteria bacterium]|uniref:regulatory signaling modulator protein AmpE n=1 Tax=Pseudomaricurvus alcaniphilus TaxID=1166482 RepID=UPI001407AAEA|nr:regulatory signaling modulator protein AmpE [Pseudomaricurvus alcaniphilus]MBR9909039.1 regulatory signaling modulator protein AmpE [Gammaproteobacteria bacterium]NHN38091.1 regulatory signaling modulator protein AmpE [Pseudomaricurvus alcaniphilus]